MYSSVKEKKGSARYFKLDWSNDEVFKYGDDRTMITRCEGLDMAGF